MFLAHFTEEPWQDPKLDPTRVTPGDSGDPTNITIGNKWYDPVVGHTLYNRYIDEKIYAEEVGFDGLMLNEHHSMPGCMQSVTNVQAAILARVTSKVKIAVLGNLLPVWDDPLWLAEQLAMIDMISRGRLVSGLVRGTGRESLTHNINPVDNWDRFIEGYEFIRKAWTVPGPFRWDGHHYQYRYVNPWTSTYQKPHPPFWIPGTGSRETVVWCARNRLPYMSFSSSLEGTKQLFELYRQTAREVGYEAGPEYFGYNWKIHVDETEELAYETGKKFLAGVRNPFIVGNEGQNNPAALSLPGLAPKGERRRGPTSVTPATLLASARNSYDDQLKNSTITVGSPTSILPKIKHVLEYLRVGTVFVWDGDGAMTHDDQMRSLRLMGSDVLPAMRDMAKELGLPGPFEKDPIPGSVTTSDIEAGLTKNTHLGK